jgi:hypothetical protein
MLLPDLSNYSTFKITPGKTVAKIESIHKVLLLGLVAAITFVFFRSQGTHDLNTWLTWGHHAYEHGIVEAYAMDGNLYPPFAEVLLWLSYVMAMLMGVAPVWMLKFSLLVFLLATTVIFYRWSNNDLAATLCFYAAMLLSSLGLAYLDIYFAPVLLLSLYRLQQGKITQFALFFMLACLIKFPPLLTAPFFIVYIAAHYLRRQQLRRDLTFLCRQILLPCFILLVPVMFLFGKSLIIALLKTGSTAWLSAWALNFNWIVTRIFLQNGWGVASPTWYEASVAIMNPVPQNVLYLAKGLYLFFFSSTLIAFTLQKKTFANLLLFAVLGNFAYFMFYTGVHENHLFLASLLAAALFCVDKKNRYLSFGLLLISSLNMFFFYGASGSNSGGFLFHPDMSSQVYSYWLDAPLLIACSNTIYFLVLWFYTMASGWAEMTEHCRSK